MTFPTSRQTDSAERVAESLDSMISTMLDQLQAWRNRINTNSATGGQDASENYQRLTSVRTFVAAKVALNPSAITAAYQRRFAGLGSFNPATEWASSKTAIDAFVSWFQANWPQRTAAGHPAFVQFNATTGELQDLSVPLAGATKTTVLGNIDAVLATFT